MWKTDEAICYDVPEILSVTVFPHGEGLFCFPLALIFSYNGMALHVTSPTWEIRDTCLSAENEMRTERL